MTSAMILIRPRRFIEPPTTTLRSSSGPSRLPARSAMTPLTAPSASPTVISSPIEMCPSAAVRTMASSPRPTGRTRIRASRAPGVSAGPLMGAVVTADDLRSHHGSGRRGSVEIPTYLVRRAEDAYDDTGRDSDENTGWGAVEVHIGEVADQHSDEQADRVREAQAEQTGTRQPSLFRVLSHGDVPSRERHCSSRAARSNGTLLATSTSAATPPMIPRAGSGPPVTETATPPNASNAVQPYMISTALVWLWPISSSRWCRWALSGANGDRPARVRRTTASSRSKNGTASTANGSSRGSSAGSAVAVGRLL